MGRKSLQEVSLRRTDVLEQMLLGYSRQHIIAYISNEYGVRKDAIDGDMAFCRKEMMEIATKQREEAMDIHLNRYELIYNKAMNPDLPQLGEAMKALKAKELILGMHKDTPTVQVNTLNLSGVETTDLKQIKEILIKK